MAEIIKVSQELGERLHEESYVDWIEPIEVEGKNYTYVTTKYNVDEHRWADTQWDIFKRDDGKLFALAWDSGSTEEQESGFVYSEPKLFEVEAFEVTTTDYKEV